MSLSNVFNDVIGQSNQTFGSGLNQKRFNGKVSTAAVKMGSTKGRGSTTRMYNYCTQTSEEPSNCINAFISAAPPPSSPDILFNTSTFSNLFDYDGIGAKKLPTKYLNGLISAANRWNQFIKFNRDTINLIRNVSTNNNWNGIELTNVTYVTRSIEASVRITVINYTTLNISFTLEINDVAIGGYNDSSLSDIFTHELGHTLGFSNWSSRVDGKEGGAILLPYLITNIAFYSEPWCTIYPPYKNMNIGYNNYWGTIDWENRKIDGKTTPLNIVDNKGTHLYPGYFNSIEEQPQPPTNSRSGRYLKRGFANEIMLPQFVNGRKFFISQVSLGYLLDLFTNWRGTNYFNYVLKNGQSEVTSFNTPRPGGENADFYIYFNGEKSFQLDSNNIISKNIEETTTIKTFNCDCCDVIHLKI
jgi:hypothetical protein